jgi:serine protease Do
MYRDTSAYRAGLRPGDVIVAFNGTAIANAPHLSRLIADARIGSTANLDVIRDGRRLALEIPIVRTSPQ